MQLLELGVPMVVALNMMDELRENGGSVLVNEMEDALGVPVIPISAAKAEGIEEFDPACHPCSKISGKTTGNRFLPKRGRGSQRNSCSNASDRGSC